jgi:glycosyltransferase involved in cell wall biosynthesis
VLEAMRAGAPVITSNVSSLPEVAGDAALLVDPLSVPAIAGALARLLADPGERARLREAGLARAALFSWERTARELRAVLRRIAR